MVNRKTVSALTIAAVLACAVPVRSTTTAWVAPLLGQATPSFPIPTSVEEGTEITVSSSSENMNAISKALKAGFEADYAQSKVAIETKDANAAIQDVLSGNADLAAISRPLTAEEKAKGLIELPIRREKIAIVVDKDNPFSQSLTGSQFAQIFRGEIKDWAAVGGSAGAIQLVDRPDTSETRQALRPYPVFTTAPFTTAAGATKLEAEATDALVTALGDNGIGYVLVGELEGQPELKALQLHKTPPSDPRYPFSQPYSFVYAGGASPAVSAFLGYATGNPGQAVVNDAGISGIGLIPDATNGTAAANADSAAGTDEAGQAETGQTATDADETQPGGEATAETAPDADSTTLLAPEGAIAGPDGELGTADDINIAGPDGILGTADDVRLAGPDGVLGTPDDVDVTGPDGILGTADDIDLAGPDGVFGTADDLQIETEQNSAESAANDRFGGLGDVSSQGRWWWLLLPLAGLGLLIWAAGKRGEEEDPSYIAKAEKEGRLGNSDERDAALDIGGERTSLGGPNADLASDSARSTRLGIGKIAAGSAAVAGGAAAGAGLKRRMTEQPNDIETDFQAGVTSKADSGIDSVEGTSERIKGAAADGIDGVQGSAQTNIDNLRTTATKASSTSTVGASTDTFGGLQSKIQGGIDTTKSGVQGSIDGVEEVGTELRTKAQGSVSSVKEGRQNSKNEGSNSWLDRAKQRINDATEQVKETASDLKEDITDND